MTEIVLDYTPQPRQLVLHETAAQQILYGGAVGGAKFLPKQGVVLTPFGWKKCNDLNVGDRINAVDGTTCRIVQLHAWTEQQGVEVTFHDGTSTVVAWGHLWLAWRSGKRRKQPNGESVFGEAGAEVVETRELYEWLQKANVSEANGTQPNWPLIPICKPQVFNVQRRYKIDLDPYQLGYWLGDGHESNRQIGFTTIDHENFVANFGEDDITFRANKQYLLKGPRRKHWHKQLGRAKLLGTKSATKFIPKEFLWGSIETRTALLQGLMDTDGTVDERGHLSYTTISKKLGDGVAHVVQSLGGTATITTSVPTYMSNGEKKNGQLAYRLYIKLPDERMAFRLERKKGRTTAGGILYRRIVDIREAEPVKGRCLTVSHPNGLYMTNDFIVTHNSHGLRWEAIRWCLKVPGIDTFLFRRSLPELENNHIRALQQEVPPELGEYKESKRRFNFSNGSGINLCYCEREQDVTRYQGTEMHLLLIDEASQFTQFQINYLRGRVRLGRFMEKIPEEYKAFLPRIVFGSNPGGPGHAFLKRVFIDPEKPETIFYDKTMKDSRREESKGWTTIFIPSKMSDNKYLDPNYGGQLEALPEELARALRDGDWDAVVGQALHNLSRDRHLIRKFDVPKHWTKFMSIDWGSAKPFSVGWYCVSEGVVLKGRGRYPDRYLPEGAIIRYDEWYGWNGKQENVGLRWDAGTVARRILDMESERKEVMDYRIGDSQMWAQVDGPSPAENMMTKTDGRFVMRKSIKDRKRNYAEFISRLAGNPEFTKTGVTDGDPMFFATENCIHFWRTVPSLVLDPNDPEKGPETIKSEDHPYDDTAYGLASRPYIMTEEDRWQEENYEFIKGNSDPYAV